MSARNPPNPIQRLVLFVVLGILFSALMSNMQRAKQRAGSARERTAEHQAEVEREHSVDGGRNTIDVSDISDAPGREGGAAWGGRVAPIIPIAVIVAVLTLARRRRRPGHA